MKADILRKSILQYAIQGKLVPQIPSEESAHILLEKIKKEKQELIKQSKLKKEKPLPEITDDEIPFDIPESWAWVRHNEIFEVIGGSQPPKEKFIYEPKEGYIRLYQTRDYGERPQPTYIKITDASKTTKQGDILLARYGGSLGKIFIAKDGAYNVAMAKVEKLYSSLNIFDKYLLSYYQSNLYQDLVCNNTRSAQAGFNKEDLNSLLFPLPPLEEQKRIVAKIEELMALIDKYELYETELEKLEIEFPEKFKKSILQYAIQGKLVPQIPSEESAHILLEKIKKEKQDLIKQGKLKKEKPIAEITDDEIPFDIPENWVWVKLIDLCKNIHYGFNASASLEGNAKLIRITDIQNNKIKFENVPYCIVSEKEYSAYGISENDILIARTGGTVGKTYIVKELPKGKFVFASYLIRAIPSCYIFPKYIKGYMESSLYWEQIKEKSMGTGQPNVNGESLKNLFIPLPPLAEQKRIVAKIEEILGFINLLSGDKKVVVNKITISSSSTEETKIIEFPKPKFDVGDFELAARQTADVPSDTMEEVIKQVKEHYDNKN